MKDLWCSGCYQHRCEWKDLSERGHGALVQFGCYQHRKGLSGRGRGALVQFGCCQHRCEWKGLSGRARGALVQFTCSCYQHRCEWKGLSGRGRGALVQLAVSNTDMSECYGSIHIRLSFELTCTIYIVDTSTHMYCTCKGS